MRPSQLVAPVRVTGAKSGKDVTVTLPAVDHEVLKGHRLRLVLASTDLGYASPAAPAPEDADGTPAAGAAPAFGGGLAESGLKVGGSGFEMTDVRLRGRGQGVEDLGG